MKKTLFTTVYKNNQTMTMNCFKFPPLQENQKDLENATETMSEYLERDISSDAVADIKQKVQDKSR